MASDELKNTPDKIPAPGLSAKVDKKRKRQAEETLKQDKSATTTPKDKSTEGPNKKKQRKGKNNSQQKGKDGKQNQKGKGEPKQKENTKPEPEPKRDESNHAIDESIAMMDGRLLADHFAQKLRKVNKEITAVELNDLCVSGILPYTILVLFYPNYYFQTPSSWIQLHLTPPEPWINSPRS